METLAAAADLFGLVAEPTRVRLLRLLAEHELSVAELVAVTELPQSSVSTHLGKLRDAGMVRDRKDGTSTYYALARLSAPGSCVVATYHDAAFGWESVPLTVMVRAVGEPFRTRLRPDEVRELFVARGFDIEQDEGTAEWSARYLGERGYRSGERLVVARRRA